MVGSHVQLAGVVTLALAVTLRCDDSDELYPWLFRLPGGKASDPVGWIPRPVHLALGHGCPGNESIGGTGTTFASFAAKIQHSSGFRAGTIADQTISVLTGRNRKFNRYVWICPFAVYRALQLKILEGMRASTTGTVASDPDAWTLAWHEVNHAQRAVKRLEPLLNCPSDSCGPDWDERLRVSLAPFNGWDGTSWIQRETRDLNDVWRAGMEQPVHVWLDNMTDYEHFELVRDGNTIMEHARGMGVLHSWVVSHGTMAMALRYGSNRADTLPSAYREVEGARTFDMDIYVHTDQWENLCTTIAEKAYQLNFKWCGWVTGWPKHSLQCWRGEGELEIHNIDKRDAPKGDGQLSLHPLSLSMAPPSRCAGARNADVVIELPCPNDPLVFMQYLWRERQHYTDCLALPMNRQREADPLTEEDVRFLWDRALDLHKNGFMSMAVYFGSCNGHPLSALAQSLYWQHWTWG